jgi:hypothetical protein
MGELAKCTNYHVVKNIGDRVTVSYLLMLELTDIKPKYERRHIMKVPRAAII